MLRSDGRAHYLTESLLGEQLFIKLLTLALKVPNCQSMLGYLERQHGS
jgi:hypothetical protein